MLCRYCSTSAPFAASFTAGGTAVQGRLRSPLRMMLKSCAGAGLRPLPTRQLASRPAKQSLRCRPVCSAATEPATQAPAPSGNSAGPAAEKKKPAAKAEKQEVLQLRDGRFVDYRWKEGRWVLSEFANKQTGGMDWPAWNSVIDAEIVRRQLLEESPVPSTNEEPVLFDTAEIPWWAWIRRFHLPEAEKLNGRACMVGYFMALLVDKLTGVGLADQQGSFLGLLSLHVVVFAVLLVPNIERIKSLRDLLDEATFYDKQWSATWDGQERPKESL